MRYPVRRRPRGLGQYSPPDYFDTGWAGVFVAACESIGADPIGVAEMLMNESGFNPSAQNSIGCVGLNQICPGSQGIFSSDYSVADYLQLTVSEQIPYVFAYFQQWMNKYGLGSISARDLYWINFLPATYVPNSPDSYVIATKGDGYYDANASFDVDGTGTITAGDLQTALDNQATAKPDLYGYLSTQIYLAGGLFPTTPWLIGGGLALGFGAFFLMGRLGR
jgi:hypothetical protein